MDRQRPPDQDPAGPGEQPAGARARRRGCLAGDELALVRVAEVRGVRPVDTDTAVADLPAAKALMKDAGFANGFPVSLYSVATNATLTQIAQLLQSYMKQIGIDLTIQGVDAPTFSRAYGTGGFDWLLNQRGIRGDVHGFVSEFNPSTSPNYNLWFNGYKNIPMWRLVGNGQITLDQAKRLPMYTSLQQILLTELLEVPLLVAYKYQVVNKRLQNMYVSYTDFNPGLRTAWLAS